LKTLNRRALMGAAAAAIAGGAAAQQTWSPPPAAQRCPSRWGANDRRGAMNLMTPERAKAAAGLVRTGEIVELGHVLATGIPLQATRQFHVHLKQMFMNQPPNQRGSNEEIVITELGQVGTQFDMFPHQTIGGQTYNCVDVARISGRSGFSEMGVETVGTIFTRGVFLDIAGLKGVPTLADDYEITVPDLEQAMQRQNVQLAEGDAVIFHTGWGRLWGRENARYIERNPGIGVAAAEFVLARNPILLGADTATVEVSPSKTMPSASLPVHQLALVVHGVHLLENMKLDELATRNRAEFALLAQPLKIKGGTGSTVGPSALL
jgi:kynurenine formamidase